MKIILSRKGFDSSIGGYPSPILPNGTIVSLPINDSDDKTSYSILQLENGKSYLELMKELGISKLYTKSKVIELHESTTCHLDPDINPNIIKRTKGWNGAFGQLKAAQGHLYNKKIMEEDLFLFFGWFRKTKKGSNGKLEFYGPDLQVIWGYLQIGEILKNENLNNTKYEWLKSHPHYSNSRRRKEYSNTIYVASEKLSLFPKLPGYGILKFKDSLVLTKEGLSRSRWELDKCFIGKKISYHSEKSWKENYFQSAMIGQEFVVESDIEIIDWVKEKLKQ